MILRNGGNLQLEAKTLPNKECTRSPAESAGAIVVGRYAVCTPYGQSSMLRGLKLVPAKWRCLIPPPALITHTRALGRGATQYPEAAYPQGASQTQTVAQKEREGTDQ
jgi:hypothetical protein